MSYNSNVLEGNLCFTRTYFLLPVPYKNFSIYYACYL